MGSGPPLGLHVYVVDRKPEGTSALHSSTNPPSAAPHIEVEGAGRPAVSVSIPGQHSCSVPRVPLLVWCWSEVRHRTAEETGRDYGRIEAVENLIGCSRERTT